MMTEVEELNAVTKCADCTFNQEDFDIRQASILSKMSDLKLKCEELQAKLKIAVKALHSIGSDKAYHRIGGTDDCAVCLALLKINEVKNDKD